MDLVPRCILVSCGFSKDTRGLEGLSLYGPWYEVVPVRLYENNVSVSAVVGTLPNNRAG